MRKGIIVLAIATLFPITLSTAQFVLQPWVQVFGTVPGQQLGAEVRGIAPTANLPYRASIRSFGNTGLYTLEAQSDTGARRLFTGGNMQTGDLNGDAWEDLVVRNGNTITIYWGTPSGIDTIAPLTFTGVGDFGHSICIGNIIGNATADLIIGAPSYPTAAVSQGRVSIYRGGMPVDTIPAVIINGDSAKYTLGNACAIGDLNDDGRNDLVVRGDHQTTPRFNYVDIWFCGASFDTVKDIHLTGSEILADGLACFDANGDGIADLLWTNKDSTQIRADVWVHFGGTAFSTAPSMKLLNPTAPTFGNVIANAGDMNGDGYDEIAVGAYSVNQTDGFVFIFGGGPQIDPNFDAAVGMDLNSSFGWSVSGLGDVTGDGLSDIIVGAPDYAFGDQRGYWGIFKGDSAIRVTPVKEGEQLPRVMTLHQAYPNPFNPQTTIRYDLSTSATVTLEVFNLLGQRVTLLVHGGKAPGSYEAVLDGSGLASGAYLYRLTARTQDGRTYTDTRRLTLVQ